MNSDKPLETAAILFLANLYLKQDISSNYIMVDLICKGLIGLWGTRVENYKMKNACQQWNSKPVHSAYIVNAIRIALLDLISMDISPDTWLNPF